MSRLCSDDSKLKIYRIEAGLTALERLAETVWAHRHED